jgi:hypothetical protein
MDPFVFLPSVNTPPAEREASGSPLEGGEDNFIGHLKPKFVFPILVIHKGQVRGQD